MKIGETFDYGSVTLIVVGDDGVCKDCYFLDKDCATLEDGGLIPYCMNGEKYVHFEEVLND